MRSGNLIAIALAVLAGTKPSLFPHDAGDIQGWRSASWGMSEDQVLDTFKGEVHRTRPILTLRGCDCKASLSIPRFREDGVDFEVFFGFAHDGLAAVLLQARAREVGKRPSSRFDDVENGFAKVYGPGTLRRHPPDGRGRAWQLPSTIITLARTRLPPIDYLIITYTPTRKQAR